VFVTTVVARRSRVPRARTITFVFDAVLFDFGGVVTTSPFDAFAEYERRLGVDVGTIRSINATAPDDNAWARLERGELDLTGFVAAFEAEARTAGVELSGEAVLACLAGRPRPRMVDAVRRCSEHLSTAIVTNNFRPAGSSGPEAPHDFAGLLDVVDVVVESSVEGVRKPEPAFYLLALERLGVAPDRAVLLDDLGVNLKPARALGVTTIKVVDPDEAIDELAALLGLQL
jgi:putative hydrolase of the HAD superfamily